MRASILVSLFTIILLIWILGFKKMRIIVIILLLCSVSIISFVKDDLTGSAIYQKRFSNVSNIESRISTYKTGLELVKNNFLFGVGYRNYSNVSLNYESRFNGVPALKDPHNGFLLITGQLGIAGIMVFIFMS